MKKFILLLPLLCLVFTSKAQYYPMFGYDHTWLTDFSWVAENPSRSQQQDNLQYNGLEAKGDTLIDTVQYYKAKITETFGNTDTTFFFREDTTAQKVWILTGDSGKEKLLYDFSLQTGDSVYLTFDFQDTGSLYYDKTGWYFVDSVKTVQIYAGPRKALFLNNPHNKFRQSHG